MLDRRTVSATLAAAMCVLALGACTSSPTPPPVDGAPATSTPAEPSPTATSGLSVEDETTILGLWDDYWQTYVVAYGTLDDSTDLWTDFAGEDLVRQEVAQVKSYQSMGVVFSGTPRTSDVRVVRTGADTAQIHACLDETDWKGTMDGEPLPPRPEDVYPIAFGADRLTGEWRLNTTAKVEEGATC